MVLRKTVFVYIYFLRRQVEGEVKTILVQSYVTDYLFYGDEKQRTVYKEYFGFSSSQGPYTLGTPFFSPTHTPPPSPGVLISSYGFIFVFHGIVVIYRYSLTVYQVDTEFGTPIDT